MEYLWLLFSLRNLFIKSQKKYSKLRVLMENFKFFRSIKIKMRPVYPSNDTILSFNRFKTESVCLTGAITGAMLHAAFLFVYRNLNKS